MIDCDVHCAPASLAALTPYLEPAWRSYAENAGVKLSGLAHAYPPAAGHAPAPTTYVALRADLLDREQPELAILNCLTTFEAHRHPYYGAALARAVNDWLRAEWLDRDERLRASVVVPLSAPDLAVEEIRRVADDPRFVQVLLPVRSETPYGNRRYHRLLRAASDHGLVVGLHAWGANGTAPLPGGRAPTYFEDYVGNQLVAQSQLLSLVSEGVFAELPELRVCLIECDFTWLPSLLWRFDKDWKGLWPEVPWVKELPSSYVRRHFRATTAPASLPQDGASASSFLELVGREMLVYASDYPHAHASPYEALAGALGGDAPALLDATARDLYGFEVRAA